MKDETAGQVAIGGMLPGRGKGGDRTRPIGRLACGSYRVASVVNRVAVAAGAGSYGEVVEALIDDRERLPVGTSVFSSHSGQSKGASCHPICRNATRSDASLLRPAGDTSFGRRQLGRAHGHDLQRARTAPMGFG
jgi:hypothetical protein